MGLAFVVLKQDTQAINAFREAAKLQPVSPYPKYEMGMAYHRLNQTDKVADVIQQLNEFDPKMTKSSLTTPDFYPRMHPSAEFACQSNCHERFA